MLGPNDMLICWNCVFDLLNVSNYFFKLKYPSVYSGSFGCIPTCVLLLVGLPGEGHSLVTDQGATHRETDSLLYANPHPVMFLHTERGSASYQKVLRDFEASLFIRSWSEKAEDTRRGAVPALITYLLTTPFYLQFWDFKCYLWVCLKCRSQSSKPTTEGYNHSQNIVQPNCSHSVHITQHVLVYIVYDWQLQF